VSAQAGIYFAQSGAFGEFTPALIPLKLSLGSLSWCM